MQSKSLVIAVYALIGLGIALWPIWIKRNTLRAMSKFYGLINSYPEWIWKPVFLAITSLGVMRFTGQKVASTLTLTLVLVSLATSFSNGKINSVAMLTSFLALCISTVIPWWQRQNGYLEISIIKLLAFGIVTLVFVHLFSSRETIKNNKSTVYWIVAFTLLATMLTFSTGILVDDNALLTQWHHWSAYIAPAELLLSGATIFHDFPVQYGLGPTTLIASFCGYDCWVGMYFIAGLTTLISSILIAVLAFSITNNRWSERLAVTILCLATCFFGHLILQMLRHRL